MRPTHKQVVNAEWAGMLALQHHLASGPNAAAILNKYLKQFNRSFTYFKFHFALLSYGSLNRWPRARREHTGARPRQDQMPYLLRSDLPFAGSLYFSFLSDCCFDLGSCSLCSAHFTKAIPDSTGSDINLKCDWYQLYSGLTSDSTAQHC